MPWNGDQFEYTHGYIQAIIENYLPLQKQAEANPGGNSAVVVYDIARAIGSAGLTPKQAEAMLLRMEGLTELEIGAVLGCGKPRTWKRLNYGFRKVCRFFEQEGEQNPEKAPLRVKAHD